MEEIGSWPGMTMQQGSHRRQVIIMKPEDGNKGDDTPARTTTATRKGPWTEEEDAQLVRFVRLLGERRWDFLAKVSGLKRTGKSCRLRWVNYLHPGLRRGRITADEERIIIELHAKWGSRWSRIARSLPGRTDNEIKNFWRTRTRKKAMEQRKQHQNNDNRNKMMAASPSSSSSVTSSGIISSIGSLNSGDSSSPVTTESTTTLVQERSGSEDEAAGLEEASTTTAASQHYEQQGKEQQWYTMDQLWNEIAAAEAAASWGISGQDTPAAEPPLMPPSPVWEFCSDYSLWRIDDEEYYKKMLDAS